MQFKNSEFYLLCIGLVIFSQLIFDLNRPDHGFYWLLVISKLYEVLDGFIQVRVKYNVK